MGQKYTGILDKHAEFIEKQKIFFVATAAEEGRVNVSPKGMDALRVLGDRRVIWLNVTGSGNETAAHVQVNARMTVMFCAFTGSPLILRLYGHARVIHHNDPEWAGLYEHFDPIPGARQIFDLSVDSVQTACGMAVPYLEYKGDRDLLWHWADNKGEEGLKQYWARKNQTSIDGLPTHILDKNL